LGLLKNTAVARGLGRSNRFPGVEIDFRQKKISIILIAALVYRYQRAGATVNLKTNLFSTYKKGGRSGATADAAGKITGGRELNRFVLSRRTRAGKGEREHRCSLFKLTFADKFRIGQMFTNCSWFDSNRFFEETPATPDREKERKTERKPRRENQKQETKTNECGRERERERRRCCCCLISGKIKPYIWQRSYSEHPQSFDSSTVADGNSD